MMPYRSVPIVIRGRPRSKWKTLRWRLALWWRGPWAARFVRCAICGKSVLPARTVYPGGGNPGDRAVNMIFAAITEFPCGHTVMDHKRAAGDDD